MFIAMAIGLMILSLAVHELGHAWAMHSTGVKLSEIGFGIPISRIPHLKFKVRRRNGESLAICLHPLILGAYVKTPDEEQARMETMPYKDQSYIFGAGILANLIFAGVLLMTADLFFLGAPFVKMLTHRHFLLVAGITFLLIVGRKFFCKYVIVVMGAAMVALVIWSVTKDPLKSLAGPVGIVRMVSHLSTSVGMAINMAAVVSFALGTCNALPLVPLDGGLIVQSIMDKAGVDKNIIRAYKMITFAIFIALVIMAFTADFVNIFK